jgi:integrase
MKVKKPSFSIILFKSKVLVNGEHPVMIRATFNRERKYYSLGMSALPYQWNNELARHQSKRLTEDQRKDNHSLNDYAGKLKDMEEHFSKAEFTFDKFEAKFFKSSTGKVADFFKEVIKQLEEQNRLGSARAYQNTLARLKEFKPKDIAFLDIDAKFLQQFDTHLKKNNSPATRGIYLRTLRAVYNRAIQDNLIKAENYPFKAFKIESYKGRKKALTKEQLKALQAYKAAKGSRIWHSRNLFLFSYYCRGMNLTDMASLQWKDIRSGRIFYNRQKTNSNIDVLIDKNLAAIIAEYPGNDFIFPILEHGLTPKTERYRIHAKLKKINQDLQTIAMETNLKALPDPAVLPEDLTFYWARHTYATTLKRAGVSIATIQETLGHSSEAVTRNYLDSFETNQLDEISKHL